MKKSALTIAALATAISGTAFAATNPTAPTAGSSSGTADVSITRGDGIMISGLADFTFGVQATSPVAPISDGVCVYATAGGEYTVTASSANPGGGTGFQMADVTDTTYIEYSVAYDDGGGAETLTQATASSQQTGGDESNLDCGGVDNGTLTVTVDSTTFDAAPVAVPHGDTLTVLVTLN